ncbi:MAG TPA: DNA recombination protein RmuC [Candidatus Coproplasma excrementigallinarum]|uniref:DNA recombination protein RmuC n=1 Tax=Candidatus Coproplasma excrementigallinarum TaxID=2840747 RepID=A0A9D1MJ99_9FIRM|nr:DNA recombination protein RmuC [Candidatus Coproplasma excrementigallinarum]
MTDILILIAIGVGVVCLIAVIAVGLRVKNTSAGQNTQKLEEIERMLIKLEAASGENSRLVQAQEARINDLKKKLDDDLKYIGETTAKSVESIRLSVEEKLSATLEGKLSKSYEVINAQLEKVYRGIGEVNSLASNVTDIKKLFSNVKLRGTWGEVQLGTLLSQMLAPNQYASSVKVDPRSDGMVDFAVRLPSRDERTVWLPIDSKFPIEEYTRLVDATDKAAATAALKNLAQAVKLQADSIASKYIFPPSTTDFAVMYLPLEGLYAEITKLPELDGYLRKRRVLACGPTNLSALLSTLQTGFKTIAIEKRSGELWQLLSAFKVQFDKFAAILEKTGKKLQEAQNTIEEAGKRTRTISNKLRSVADIGDEEAEKLLTDGED